MLVFVSIGAQENWCHFLERPVRVRLAPPPPPARCRVPRPLLKKAKYLTRDWRMVEPKKTGQPKAFGHSRGGPSGLHESGVHINRSLDDVQQMVPD